MSAQASERGAGLLAGGQSLDFGAGRFARLWSGGARRILDRIDAGLDRGSIDVALPDGTRRRLGGRAPGFAASVELHDWRALVQLATTGSVGWYRAWERGAWDSPDPVPLFALFMDNAASLGEAGRARGPWRLLARALHWFNRNTPAQARRNIHAHYDLGNDFYAAWLDPTMTYSSAMFGAGDDLEAAQRRKIAGIAARLEGARDVLEIGCGWGSLAATLAAGGARVTAISLSDEQLAWARARHPDIAASFVKADYRDMAGQYDGIASVEMVEAVGREYWPAFFDCIARCLRPGGRAALQFIAMRDDLFEAYARSADFIQTYIFPGGLLIRESAFRRLAAERGLAWADQADFGFDYAETLKAWRANFDRAAEEGRLPAGFDQRFIRLWRFYLMYCEGGFRGGGITVSQVTLVKG